jgi:hypothetical protein
MTRALLPNRRPHDLAEFTFHGFTYTIGAGLSRAGPFELFIDAHKVASQTAEDARDIAVLISIALQYGAPVDVLRQAVGREPDGRPTAVAGAALDLITDFDHSLTDAKEAAS